MCLASCSRSAWRLPEASNAQTTRVLPCSSRLEDLVGDPVDGPLDAADVLGAAALDRDGLAEHRRRRRDQVRGALHVHRARLAGTAAFNSLATEPAGPLGGAVIGVVPNFGANEPAAASTGLSSVWSMS